MGTSWGVFHVWTAVLVGWTIKAIILKLGGLNAYTELPFLSSSELSSVTKSSDACGQYSVACLEYQPTACGIDICMD